MVGKHVPNFGGKRIMVWTYSVIEGLCDVEPALQSTVVEAVALAAATASGGIETRRQCFVCCQPWAADRAPIGVMTAEIVGVRPRQALLSLICNWCWSGGADERVIKALERDLECKRDTAQFIHDPVEAD
jgi:hypothetical protein